MADKDIEVTLEVTAESTAAVDELMELLEAIPGAVVMRRQTATPGQEGGE